MERRIPTIFFVLVEEVILGVDGGVQTLQPQKFPDFAGRDDAIECVDLSLLSRIENLRGDEFGQTLRYPFRNVFFLRLYHRKYKF